VKPDYSIIIPAYNEEALLPRTLRSLRRAMERLPEYEGEVIVTDNASTDRTAGVAAAHRARVVHEPHRQIARARNAGARLPVTAEQRDRIMHDALVQQTLELFDGAVVNMSREAPATAGKAEEPTE